MTATSREDFRRRLAAISPDARRDLEAIYRKHSEPRDDGGLPFTLDDHLWQAYRLGEDGFVSATRLLPKYAAALCVALGVSNREIDPVRQTIEPNAEREEWDNEGGQR
jgi:hypothetical protein